MGKTHISDENCSASVERVLEPLVTQISRLIDRNDSLERPKGLSKNKSTILDLIKTAIGDLIKCTEEISSKYPNVGENFQVALSEVQDVGQHFYKSVSSFLENPVNEESHAKLLKASRGLLSSVTRILIIADLTEVNQLHCCLENIKGDADCIGILTDEAELPRLCSLLKNHLGNLQTLLKYRSQDLPHLKQNDFDNSQIVLNLACEIIVLSTKASFRHPDLATLAANREFAVSLANEATDRLGCACDPTYATEALPPLQGQATARLMQEIVKSAETGVEKIESWSSIFFQSNVLKLSAEVASLLQSAGLTDHAQADIARELHELSEAADQFIEVRDYETPTDLEEYVMAIGQACTRIRSLISQAALTLCSSTFPTNDAVLSEMEESAKCANEDKLVLAVMKIQQQTSDLIDSALCLCGLWTDANVVRFVRIVANDLEQLAPQLINASKAVALRSQSSIAKENFSKFIEAYKLLVRTLGDSIDEMTDVLDFLEVHDRLLQADIHACQSKAKALQTGDLMSASRKLSTRCSRAIKYILSKLKTAEQDNLPVDQVQGLLENINENLLPKFTETTKEMCRSLHSRSESSQIETVRYTGEAIRSAFSGLRPLLEAVYSHGANEFPSHADITFEFHPPTPSPPRPSSPQMNEFDQEFTSINDSSEQSLQSSKLSPMPLEFVNETTSNLTQVVDQFNTECTNLMRHLEKMEEGNSGALISLIQNICRRLTDAIGYLTVCGGSAAVTDDKLVKVTREISWMAAQLNGNFEVMVRGPFELNTKRNLFTTLKNINLFSHELAVMSRVKANMKMANKVLCLDDATALIQAARNLIRTIMQAIIEVRIIAKQRQVCVATALPPVPLRPRQRPSITLGGSDKDQRYINSFHSFAHTIADDRTSHFLY